MPTEFNPASFQIEDTIDLVDATEKQLREQAKLFNVHGRSKMNKQRLLKTINDLQCQICDYHLDNKDTEEQSSAPSADDKPKRAKKRVAVKTDDDKPKRQKSQQLDDATISHLCLVGNRMLASGAGWKAVYAKFADLGQSDAVIHNMVTAISRQKVTMPIRSAFMSGDPSALQANDEPTTGTEFKLPTALDNVVGDLLEREGFTHDWFDRETTIWHCEAQLTEEQQNELRAELSYLIVEFTVN